ncbi:CapA family protein [Paenibacillus glufosinatiresistens]
MVPARTSAAASPVPSAAVSASPASVPAKPGKSAEPLTMAFAGDILLDGYVGNQIARYGTKYPFLKTAPLLKPADLAFANLETPVSIRGKASQGKTFVFRSKPETLEGLVYAGIDGVTLANNHILDYGQQAMLDTLIHLDRNRIGRTGAGANIKEAFRPYVKTIGGKSVAVLGVSRVLSGPAWYAGEKTPGAASAYTDEPMLSAVRASAKTHDFTVVYIHWNQEFKDYPEAYARKLARSLIDSGADLIIGAHSHCLMGVEYYKHKPIYYSLGNFVFNRSTRGGDKTLRSMIATFKLDPAGKLTSRVVPVQIKQGQPTPMDPSYNRVTYNLLNKLSYNAVVDTSGNVREK